MLPLGFYKALAIESAAIGTEARAAWPIDWPSRPEGIAVIDRLTQETIDEGRATTFVQVLVQEIRQRRANAMRALVGAGDFGEVPSRLYTLAARAAAYGEVLRLIEDSHGKEAEEP